MSDGQRNEELEALFHQALQLAADERDAFLVSRCGDDEPLLAQLRALLKQDAQRTKTILRGNALPGSPGSPNLREAAGRIGHYSLLELLGEGGMGTVYLAWQEEPVRRKVALKMIRIGAGSDEVMARFETERQALALMDHPGIARIYDGGVAESGMPYFVMEYVRGLSLLEYTDRFRLTIEERIRLFCHICDAVQHAHQKGIVHRDLKPGNVLVVERDGEPQPKIIDFGIARAVSGPLTREQRTVTAGQTIGTYAYMSPEQADPRGQDIDTRADVYSLGVVLYELLSGRRPFEAEDAGNEGWLQVIRQLLEQEAPLPSSRILAGEVAAIAAAASRRRTVKSLARSLTGDLDWIVMKAIDKDRTRRYATVSELKTDLLRSLEDEPVTAGPPTTAYRARKFVRRHKTGVGLAAAFALLLIAGLLGTGLSLRRALSAEEATRAQLAETRYQAEKAEAFIEFLDYALSEGLPAATDKQLTVLDLFDPTSAAIPELFANRPGPEASVRYILGRAYLLLGNDRRALEQLHAAYSIQKAALPEDHTDLFMTLQLLIHATRRVDGIEASEPYVGEILVQAREILRERRPDLVADLDALSAAHAGDETTAKEALKRLKELVDELPEALHRADEPAVLGRLVLEAALRLPDGEEVLATFVEKARRIGGIRYLSYLWVVASLELRAEHRNLDAAAKHAAELSAECSRILAPNHWLSIDARRLCALTLAGRFPERMLEAEAELLAVFDEVELMPGRKNTRLRGAQQGLLQLSELLEDIAWVDESWTGWCERNTDAGEVTRHWWVVTYADVSNAARARAVELLDAAPRDALVELHLAFGLYRSGRSAEARSILGPRGGDGQVAPIELALRALAADGAGDAREARECWVRLQETMDGDVMDEPAEIRVLYEEVHDAVGL